MSTWLPSTLVGLVLLLAAVPRALLADDDADPARPEAASAETSTDQLVVEQAQVADSVARFRTELLRIAEQSRAADPARAELLEKAAQQLSTGGAEDQLRSILALLESQLLRDVDQAVSKQDRVQSELTALLNMLLSENRDRRNASEKDRLRQRIKEIDQAIRVQRGIQGQSERSGELPDLSQRQGQLADKTGEIVKKIKEGEDAQKPSAEPKAAGEPKDQPKSADGKSPPADGKDAGKDPPQDKPNQGNDSSPGKPAPQDSPGEAQPGMGPAQPQDPNAPQEAPHGRQQLEQATQRMRQAQKRLDEAKRSDATQEQEAAITALEKAKAELEEILRQLREEEIEKTLVMLEARFRNMLKMQQAVRDSTVLLDRKPAAQRDRTDEIEAGRLSRREQLIVAEVDKASLLLREDGSAVAFPEAVGQLREDMELISQRLGQAKIGSTTQQLEQDVLDALQEMISALEKAQKDLKAKQGQPQQSGEPSDPPLVDKIAELKMIRALQVRVNRRTAQYDEMIRSGESAGEEMLLRLRKLAEHEEKIHRIARDLHLGKNE